MDGIETHGAEPVNTRDWPARPFLLAGLGLATGIAAHLILGDGTLGDFAFTPLQSALLMAVTLGAALIGFTIERRLAWASLAFAAVVGVAAGFITWWNGAPGGWNAADAWRTFSLLLAVAIAAPLFQAARDEGALRTPYASVHDHAWANVVLWCACWLFVAIVWAMAWLLAGLFQLIKIDLLHDLLMKNWFARALVGLAFGSALGVLREHDAIVRLLQKVVTTLLAVLAPVLAIGLALFLIALPFTGVRALWDATSATTPLLLFCAAGALILCNDVIGAREAEERRNPVLRYSAMVLAAVILPLAVLAAVATGLRIGQYGYTPERLWAVVFVGIALCWGLAYFGALALRRLGWTRLVRPANLALAGLVCVAGLVLATPLINFNRISTADQVARLESGRTTPERFDWRALAFDFGRPGREALARLRGSRDPAIRVLATQAERAGAPWQVREGSQPPARREETVRNTRVLPEGTAFPRDLLDTIADSAQCSGQNHCTLFMAGPGEALLFSDDCFGNERVSRVDTAGKSVSGYRECGYMSHYLLADGAWSEPTQGYGKVIPGDPAPRSAAYRDGRIEIRKVERRQVFVGGVPVGEPLE